MDRFLPDLKRMRDSAALARYQALQLLCEEVDIERERVGGLQRKRAMAMASIQRPSRTA